MTTADPVTFPSAEEQAAYKRRGIESGDAAITAVSPEGDRRDKHEQLVDLMCSLRFWAQANEISFGDVCDSAYAHFMVETGNTAPRSLQDLKDEFDAQLSKMTDQEIEDGFAEAGCDADGATAGDRIYDYLEANPDQALDIAHTAVTGLYLDENGAIKHEEEDFPSGADYINTVCGSLHAPGILDLIEELQGGWVDPEPEVRRSMEVPDE